MELQEIITDIAELKRAWTKRDGKFKDWYDLLVLTDTLKTENMETVALNDPRTFFNMALFLLTAGEVQHRSSIRGETPAELELQSKLQRVCQFVWREIDRERQHGGSAPFGHDLGFYLLLLGWYSLAAVIDEETKILKPVIWSPAEVYPRFEDGRMSACLHEYKTSVSAAKRKAQQKGWNYDPRTTQGAVLIDDYFFYDENGKLQNHVLVDGTDVTGEIYRPPDEFVLLVAPVGGFTDTGSLSRGATWQEYYGQGILETNRTMIEAMNKWVSMLMQNLRDTIQQKYQEFAVSQKAKPEDMRRYGTVLHYTPNEGGIKAIETLPPPVETRAILMDLDKRNQKGGFNDAVYGMVDKGTAGYALSALASSSANQVLNPYMRAKDFIIEQLDRFQLQAIKKTSKPFLVKGRVNEELSPKDIPDDVSMEVSSELATPKDLMERATIANMMKSHLDEETVLSEVYKITDTSSIKRRKNLDDFNNHPVTKQLKLISSYEAYAELLAKLGDRRQAERFKKAAMALELQMGVPPPGSAKPMEAAGAEAARAAAAPEEKARVPAGVSPPEARAAWTPQELRGMIGRGTLRNMRGE